MCGYNSRTSDPERPVDCRGEEGRGKAWRGRIKALKKAQVNCKARSGKGFDKIVLLPMLHTSAVNIRCVSWKK